MLFGDDPPRQRQHLFRRGGVQRRRVLVQHQKLRRDHRRHQQRQRLPLPAGQQPHRRVHAVLQPQSQLRQLLPEALPLLFRHAGEGRHMLRRPQVRQREVFLDGEMRRCPFHGILKHSSDILAAFVLRAVGDVFPVQQDPAAAREERAADQVEQGAFACPVGADHRHEIAVRQMQRHAVQRLFLIDGAGVEGLGYVDDVKHLRPPPLCARPPSAAGTPAAF